MFWYLQAAGSMLRFFWYLLRPKKPSFNAQKRKKTNLYFCLFVRAEMTSRHKNSSKTLQNTPKMVPNSINGHNIYIGSPSKKKNRKILTQGKSCFFTVNATIWNLVPPTTKKKSNGSIHSKKTQFPLGQNFAFFFL